MTRLITVSVLLCAWTCPLVHAAPDPASRSPEQSQSLAARLDDLTHDVQVLRAELHLALSQIEMRTLEEAHAKATLEFKDMQEDAGALLQEQQSADASDVDLAAQLADADVALQRRLQDGRAFLDRVEQRMADVAVRIRRFERVITGSSPRPTTPK